MCINTENMTLTLIHSKKATLIAKATQILASNNTTIRQVASLLGSISAALEAVPLGKLHFRGLEMDKILALKIRNGNFDAPCYLSQEGKRNIIWWIENLPKAFRSLLPIPKPDYIIYTDACKTGWGGHDDNTETNGIWNYNTEDIHINILELQAIKNSLQRFLPTKNIQHVRVMTDNSTAVAHINKLGGTKSRACNYITKECWEIAQKFNSHLSASHIPGIHNSLADFKSRSYKESAEWMLDSTIFNKITNLWGVPEIDMFASHENFQCNTYVSWLPDPGAQFIDAFSISWETIFGYFFPPFSLWGRTVEKLAQEADLAMAVAPIWATQPWFVKLLEMAIDTPRYFSSSHLHIPKSKKRHELGSKLTLMAVLCSKNQVLQRQFRNQLEEFSKLHGDLQRIANTPIIKESGRTFVIQGKLIRFKPI